MSDSGHRLASPGTGTNVATIGERERDDLVPGPAPVDVGLDAVRLPAHVLQVLDPKAPKPHGDLSAEPRARMGGQRAALLIRASGAGPWQDRNAVRTSSPAVPRRRGAILLAAATP